ncbi:MAG: hypothetical protein M1830_005339, partial [Pleopsidium flavum]
MPIGYEIYARSSEDASYGFSHMVASPEMLRRIVGEAKWNELQEQRSNLLRKHAAGHSAWEDKYKASRRADLQAKRGRTYTV